MMQIHSLRPRDTLSPRADGSAVPSQDRALLANASEAANPARQKAPVPGTNAATRADQASLAIATARGGLAQGTSRLDASNAAQEADWARGFADAFETMTRDLASPATGRKAHSQYALMADVGAALSGISRQRTQTLLTLRNG
jgi:hypothetical protein